MSISEFLKNNIDILSTRIIGSFNHTFNSHDFIEKFAEIFESEYIDFLNQYKGKGAFQTVHSQIGRFLRDNENILHIKGIGKAENKNIFGNIDGIEKWEKI